ncbi:MAG: histidine kinase dimerization/phospho-acceptor domain-containing protein, partial [Chromatiaceae bacterium]
MDRPAILDRPAPISAEPQNVTLFRIYLAYRAALSILLLFGLLTPDTRQFVGLLNRDLYLAAGSFYLATNLALLALAQMRYVASQATLFAVFVVDILCISIMSDASGGMLSGLPILLVATAAASAVLVSSSTMATLIAALSVIAILVDTLRLVNVGVLELNSMLPAGLLGSLIFTVSILVQIVARQVGKAEELARSRATDLYTLQRLNEQIVQSLQTGILLVYADDSVRVMNQAAARLLDPERPIPLEQGRQLRNYHPELARQFELWRDTGSHEPIPIHISDEAPQIIANFRVLQDSGNREALVFIQDYTLVTREAQSLKLASLGRLTASIAHEIRNPLGAISHAAQLLSESQELSPEDESMAGIIQSHARRMNEVIENVLEISRRQPPKAEQLALKGWLHNFLDEYRKMLSETADIELVLPEEWVEIRFDPAHLERVLGNLLDNGLRHSALATGSRSAKVIVEKDFLANRCLIDVVDRGSGVAESERAKLFEPFYTTVDKGTGLGLYLSKELCEINNATRVYRPTD